MPASTGFNIANIPQLPPDPLFGLKDRFTKDSREDKVDLGIGAYRDNNGKPWVLPVVTKAEALLQNSKDYNHEYLPIDGLKSFTSAAAKILLGSDSKAIKEDRLVSIQTLSGTGALHVAGKFIKDFYKPSTNSTSKPKVYLSSPTWANHLQIFEFLGMETAVYPYWNNETKSLDLQGFLDTIKSAPTGSIFLLHSCAHNPTGLDPNEDEWLKILEAIDSNGHLPLFDSAYQGFASGSLEKDAWAIRTAVNGYYYFPILICQSFAKNVGMYGERVGCVHVVLPTHQPDLNLAVSSQLKKIIRSELSNPPAYGAKIVSLILNSEELYNEWQEHLITMSSRINKMRHLLRDELVALKTPGNWDHIVQQSGMFSFTGLTKTQVERLEVKHGVYLVSSGRASIAGLNLHNYKYVAQCIHEVVKSDV